MLTPLSRPRLTQKEFRALVKYADYIRLIMPALKQLMPDRKGYYESFDCVISAFKLLLDTYKHQFDVNKSKDVIRELSFDDKELIKQNMTALAAILVKLKFANLLYNPENIKKLATLPQFAREINRELMGKIEQSDFDRIIQSKEQAVALAFLSGTHLTSGSPLEIFATRKPAPDSEYNEDFKFLANPRADIQVLREILNFTKSQNKQQTHKESSSVKKSIFRVVPSDAALSDASSKIPKSDISLVDDSAACMQPMP